jgi:hypothetical protein
LIVVVALGRQMVRLVRYFVVWLDSFAVL